MRVVPEEEPGSITQTPPNSCLRSTYLPGHRKSPRALADGAVEHWGNMNKHLGVESHFWDEDFRSPSSSVVVVVVVGLQAPCFVSFLCKERNTDGRISSGGVREILPPAQHGFVTTVGLRAHVHACCNGG